MVQEDVRRYQKFAETTVSDVASVGIRGRQNSKVYVEKWINYLTMGMGIGASHNVSFIFKYLKKTVILRVE